MHMMEVGLDGINSVGFMAGGRSKLGGVVCEVEGGVRCVGLYEGRGRSDGEVECLC